MNLLLAAGKSERAGGGCKQLQSVHGRPIIWWAMRHLVGDIAIVVQEEWGDAMRAEVDSGVLVIELSGIEHGPARSALRALDHVPPGPVVIVNSDQYIHFEYGAGDFVPVFYNTAEERKCCYCGAGLWVEGSRGYTASSGVYGFEDSDLLKTRLKIADHKHRYRELYMSDVIRPGAQMTRTYVKHSLGTTEEIERFRNFNYGE